MFLRSLNISNLRSLEDVALSFDCPEGQIRKWTLVLGENGCGKSTVLRAAALVLAGSDALSALLGETDSWIRHGKSKAEISATIETAEGAQRNISLSLKRGEGISATLHRNRKSLSLLDRAVAHTRRSYLTVGYGASRRLNLNPESAFSRRTDWKSRASAVATLFSPDALLDPLEAWVIDTDYQTRSGHHPIIKAIAKDLLPDVDFHGIDKRRKQLLFKTPDGITPLSQLSDGYQNVAAWCGDLLRSITTTFDDHQNPLAARGLLLIDEIDLHLHPVWQRQLRTFFDRTFPNLQFIATTHSPLTIQQSAEGEVCVMRRRTPGGSPQLEFFPGAPNRMMLHQLVLSPLFNINTVDSAEVEAKRLAYRKLKSKATPTPQEASTLKSLSDSLSALPDMAEGLLHHRAQQDKLLTDIRDAIAAGSARPTTTEQGGTPRNKAKRRRK